MPCVSSWLALDGPHRDGWRGSFRGYFRRDRDARARQFMTQQRHRRVNIAVPHTEPILGNNVVG